MLRITPLLILCLPLAAHAQSLPATVVARTGLAVPDVPGATYSTIGTLPRLGANGDVAFNATIADGGATLNNDFGYWVGTAPANLHTALREDAANGGPNQFADNANIGVDADGRVSLWTGLAQPFNMNQRLWGYLPDGGGGSTTIAQKGVTVAPGFAGGIIAGIGTSHASNDDGAVAFTGSVSGGDVTSISNDFGLFAGTPGNLKLVAREGMPAPGATGASPVFSTTTTAIYDKRINAAGQVGFAAALSGSGVDASNDRAVYVWTPNAGGGTLALAAQTGNPAPGTGSTTTKFAALDDSPGFSDSGQVAFRSALVGNSEDVTSSNNGGVWAGAPGNVRLIAREGSPSPLVDVDFGEPEPSPRINAAGKVAFFSAVTGSGVTLENDSAFWVACRCGTELVAREGSHAPGTPAGVTFDALEPFATINGLGQLAFTATLAGPAITSATDRGLWAGQPGSLSLVAREGDVIDLDPSAGELLRTVQSISFANGHGSAFFESASAAFNDAGQIAWQAQFTAASGGGSAIFLTTVPFVPPPAVPGDYNGDGCVDAGDYVRWRNHLGDPDESALNNNGDGGDVSLTDYTWWKDRYGAPGSGGLTHLAPPGAPGPGAVNAVPEPTGVALLSLAIAGCIVALRRR